MNLDLVNGRSDGDAASIETLEVINGNVRDTCGNE
jgi:hypothetical protein